MAFVLARGRFPGRAFVDSLVHLPLVLPPVVMGYLLLISFGTKAPLGAWLLDTFGIRFAFSWTGAALAGLAAVFEVVPWLYAAMKAGGALYLIYLAWGMWRDAAKPLDTSVAARRRAFRAGLLVNIANPKSVLFAGAVIVVTFPAGLSAGDSALIVLNHLIVEICVYTAMALGLSSPPARAAYLRLKVWFDRIAAGIMGALGLRLILERE